MAGAAKGTPDLPGDGPASEAARAQYEAREILDRVLESGGGDLSVETTEALVHAFNALAPGGPPQNEGTGEVDLITARTAEAADELRALAGRLTEPAAGHIREALPYVERALEVRRSVTG